MINAFKKEDIDFSYDAIKKVLTNYNCKNVDNIFELVGSGSITSSNVLKSIFPELKINYSKKKKKKQQ